MTWKADTDESERDATATWEVICRPIGMNPAQPGAASDETPYNGVGIAILVTDGDREVETARVATDRRTAALFAARLAGRDEPEPEGMEMESEARRWPRLRRAASVTKRPAAQPDTTFFPVKSFDEQLTADLAVAYALCDAVNEPMRRAREAFEAAGKTRDELLERFRAHEPELS